MGSYQTPILGHTTPPGSPNGLQSPRMDRSPQSLFGSPFSMAHSPRTRQSDVQSPQLRSPPYFRPEDEDEFHDSEPEKPRLVIRKLVLINYKSYAGRQEVGPFNDNFTAVVGPNGSGKSNVIDSLLFVFGFRAKKMRQDKLTGLIHKSEQHPNLQSARVEVHFETIGIPDSGLVLAREVRRDGHNFYSLNGKKCSYAEVAELLEERGIDLRHKRFLILQGEVESIALMPPKAENDGDDGLLEYLEDIIGTSNYKTRIEELHEESEILRADCDEKTNRVNIVAKDLTKLDAERADVEKVMLQQNRNMVAKSRLWQLHAFRISNSIELISKEIEEYDEELSHLRFDTSSKRQSLASLELQVESNNRDTTKFKQELKDATKTLKEAQLKQVKAKQCQDQLKAKSRKAEHNLAHAKNEFKAAQIWIQNFGKDNQELNKRLKGVIQSESVERGKLEQIQAALHESTKDLHDELESLQIQAEPWREKIATKQQQLKSLVSDIAESEQQLELARQREKECCTEANTVIAAGHQAQREVKALTKHLDKLINERKEIESQLEKAYSDKEKLFQELESLRSEVVTAQEARTSSQNRNRLESELMRLKIPGLYGRLGSLGSIDEKYDIAISTAGPDLNNFVVDTVETAKKCIEELRRKSIGRAKFIVLNKLNHNMSQGKKFPAPRLLDLVKPVDPLFMKAFASTLGDTMVVSTPEEATKVAFGGPYRHKVVTLGGMVVNSSGQMGGGGKPSRGLMAKTASSISPEELESLEKRLAALELDYVEAKERYSGLVTRKDEITSEIPRIQIELEKEKMSLKELESQMTQIRESRRALQADIKAHEEAKVLTDETHAKQKLNIEQEKMDLEIQSQAIENAIQKIQGKILEAGGLRLREQSVKVSDLQKESAEIQRRIEEGQEKVAQEMSRATKLEADIARYEREVKECFSSDASKEEIVDITELELSVQKLSVLLEHHTNKTEEFKTEANVIRAEIEGLRAAEIEAQNSLEKLRRNLADNTNKLNDVRQKLKNLRLHNVSIARSLEITNVIKNEESENLETMHVDGESTGVEPVEPIEVTQKNDDSNEGLTLTELSPDELQDINEAELKNIIATTEEACKSGKLDMDVIVRYRSRFNDYVERKTVGDEAISKYERVKEEVQKLKKRRYKEFMDGFLQISAKLKEMYQLITMGGNSELELVDSMDPFAEGILFSVMPPKKSWRNIANLSGGEKTLSSLALVFALHHYKPTPLYVMDEIDAALDFRNVSIIANYIKERTKNGQFIVISLRNNMFELASRLVGVYKVNNMTKSVTLQTD